MTDATEDAVTAALGRIQDGIYTIPYAEHLQTARMVRLWDEVGKLERRLNDVGVRIRVQCFLSPAWRVWWAYGQDVRLDKPQWGIYFSDATMQNRPDNGVGYILAVPPPAAVLEDFLANPMPLFIAIEKAVAALAAKV